MDKPGPAAAESPLSPLNPPLRRCTFPCHVHPAALAGNQHKHPVNPSPRKRDPDRFFRTEEIRATLGQRSVRGGLMTGGGQMVRFVMQIAMNMILARLLTPDEFGVVAMVTSLMAVTMVIKDMGLTTAAIQREEMNHALASNLFWVSTGFITVIVLALIGLSPLLASWFGRPEVFPIGIWIAISYWPFGVFSQHRAILTRQMQFGRIALVEIISFGFAVTVGIIAAMMGASYWALVFYYLVQGFGIGIGFWIASGWMPGWIHRGANIRPLLNFGGNSAAYNLVSYLSRNLDQILIGKYIGAASLGFYERAFRLVIQPMSQVQQPLTNVALPALSRLQHEPERYRHYYRRAVTLMALLVAPPVTLSVIMAPELIYVALGPGWQHTATLFAILGITAIVTPFSYSVPWLLYSQDRTREILKMGLISSTITVAGIIIGLQWGTTGVAWGISLSAVTVRIPFMFWYAGRRGHVRTFDILKLLPFPLGLSVIVAVVCFLYRSYWTMGQQVAELLGVVEKAVFTANLVDLLTSALLSGTAVSLFVFFTPRGRNAVKEGRKLIRSLTSNG
ncbi:lipopolysaccharide biosynthesis protein [bacterium]|nr:lipopolysaccharide biosynthesis protein [bacterium]